MLSVAKYKELEELDSLILDTFLPTGKRTTSLIYGRIVSNTFTKAKIPQFPGYNLTVQEVPSGNGNGAHIHKSTEIFIFLDSVWEIGYGFDAGETTILGAGDVLVVPAYECRTYKNIGESPGHIMTILAGESWVQFDEKVVSEARKYGAICDDWGTLTHDIANKPIENNLNADHIKDFKKKEEFHVSLPEEMRSNMFKKPSYFGRCKIPKIAEGLSLEIVSVPKGCISKIPLESDFTSVVVMDGRGVLQGLQLLEKWDTALVEKIEDVSEPQISIAGLQEGMNIFLVVGSSNIDFKSED